jgi:hypothetical protein
VIEATSVRRACCYPRTHAVVRSEANGLDILINNAGIYSDRVVTSHDRTLKPSADMLRREWPLLVSIATTTLFLVLGEGWLADLSSFVWFGFMLAWLFGAILVSAFAVVRHAEGLAVRLGEPLGTLVLTLSKSGMEMMMIAAVMYTGHGESSLARDTMLAILMIVLNGLVGGSLLLGGLRYHEQTYNLYGANAFLAVILPLAVLGLVLPTSLCRRRDPLSHHCSRRFSSSCRWGYMACSWRFRPCVIGTISSRPAPRQLRRSPRCGDTWRA